jgi:hypothetical protein
MIKQMGTTMKKKMALNDGESKTQGCQRFPFIRIPQPSFVLRKRYAEV